MNNAGPSGAQFSPASFDQRLELFCGDANPAEARVYVRLSSDDPLDDWQVTGRLVGPECRFAKTLPATIRFVDRNPGPGGRLAEAIVPDPCFWTPELPFLYRAKLSVYSSRSIVKTDITTERDEYTIDRPFGIRRFGASGRSLYLDGKRWVPRGVCLDRAGEAELLAAREAGAALMLPAPDDAICESASRLGVPLFVHVDASLRDANSESRSDSATCRDSNTCQSPLAAEIRRLAQWPAVLAIILPPAADPSSEARSAARNTILAAPINADSHEIPSWAQAAVLNSQPTNPAPVRVGRINIPIIAVRHLPHCEPIPSARAACDRLQFDLAPSGDFAGYFV